MTETTLAPQIQRLTVAVVVDSRLHPPPRPATVRRLVIAAMGLRTGRGDTIQVVALPLVASAPVPARATSTGQARISRYLSPGSLGGLAVALVLAASLVADVISRRRPGDR